MNATSIGLVLGAVIAAGCSADNSLAPERLASAMKQAPAMSAESGVAPTCRPSRGPVNSLHVEGGGGEDLRLAYFAGCGWKYLATDGTAHAKMVVGKVAYDAISSTSDAVPDRENPMTVFVDGPTGYVFGWTAVNGWQFVGHLQP